MVCTIKKANKQAFTKVLLAKASNKEFTKVFLHQTFAPYGTCTYHVSLFMAQ